MIPLATIAQALMLSAYAASVVPAPPPLDPLPRAMAHYREGRFGAALNAFLQVVAERPDSKEAETALRYVWDIAQEIKKAEAPLILDQRSWRMSVEKAREIVIRRRRENRAMLEEMGSLARDLPTSREPLKELRRAPLQLESPDRAKLDELSRLKAEQHLATIRGALKILAEKPAPNPADLHEVKGYFWLYQGDFELAVKEWKAAAKQRTLDVVLTERLEKVAQHWERQKLHEEAEHELQLGISDLRAGQFRRAHRRFEKAAAIDPGDEAIVRYLTLAKKGLEDTARQERIQLLLESGRKDYLAGRTFEAVQSWVDVLVLDPSNEESRRQLARTRTRLIAAQKPVQSAPAPTAAPSAAAKAEDRAASSQQAEESYSLGLIFYNDGEFEKARGAFSEALRWRPGHAKAKKALEQVETELKNR